MANNIFDFGKSELTHDAIISWIINGFNFKESSEDFYYFSRKFIKMLDNSLNLNEYNMVEVRNQYNVKIKSENDILDGNSINKRGKIDILAIFSNESKEKYYLVIEDKVFSGESGNQFAEYHKAVIDEFYIRKENIMFVNIILGNFSKYYENKVKGNYWKIITRNDILEILLENASSNTPEFSLLNYYSNYLEKLNKEYLSFERNNDFRTWSKATIFGFFSDLVKQYHNSDFGYVNNQSGGFCGLWFNRLKIVSKGGFEFFVYQQLEFEPYDQIDSDINLCTTKELKWYCRLKLEDINYNEESIRVAKKIKLKLFKKIEGKEKGANYHPGKHLTIVSKKINSNSVNALREEIDAFLDELEYYLDEVEKIIIE